MLAGVLLVVLTALVVYLFWQQKRLEWVLHEQAMRPPVSVTERVILHRQRPQLEADALRIWHNKYLGHTHSRSYFVRQGMMSYHRWNKASQLMNYLDLKPSEISYQEGKERIQREIDKREQLSASGNYVDPYDW